MATSTSPAASPGLNAGRCWLATFSANRGMTGRATAATALSIAGVFSIFSTALYLWALWTTDPLKSIGGFIPLVSLVLILRVWRALAWETRGSWWGLVILAATVGVVHLRDHAVLELVLSRSWSIFLPPHSLVAFAYVSGAVLLFGGVRLYRAALFPIVLMWMVNPVPQAFNRVIDLPLQHASAATARAFAHTLGQRLTPDQLYLMFTPDFGMFIAPGCNGMRGAITMGLIALIAGYLYRFRLRVWAAVVGAAVLLGYVFNLVRLCALVLYYVLAVHVRSLQGHAEGADYMLGATLFFFATILLFAAIRRFSPDGNVRPPALQVAGAGDGHGDLPGRFVARWAAFALVAALGSVSYARALSTGHTAAQTAGQVSAPNVPRYAVRRMWRERLVTGQTIFEWTDYALPGSDSAVSVGVSPVLGAHDTLLCHAARGEDWLWNGTLTLPTADGEVSFSGSLYNDGATQSLEASTVCSGERCGEWASDRQHLGFVFSRPDIPSLLSLSPSRPIPVLLRVETPDAALPAEAARAQLTAELREFLLGASITSFTRPYRQP